jgi:hypothetical protein
MGGAGFDGCSRVAASLLEAASAAMSFRYVTKIAPEGAPARSGEWVARASMVVLALLLRCWLRSPSPRCSFVVDDTQTGLG